MGPGKTLGDGRYVVRAILGEGAQGVTYHATDATGRDVAIKRFDVRGAQSWKEVELAEREARVLASLDHPLLPRYVEHFSEEGALFLVMEKVEGETLQSLRQRHGTLPEEEVLRFLACADRAFSYLHGRAAPVVHRDVKPRNVLRRPDGSYVFVDFGAVRELLTPRGASTVVGTYGYMAPEQFQGRATPAADVYAIGATALAALTGADPETLPHQGLRLDVRAAVGTRASEATLRALEGMLEPDPDRRAPSVGAALDGARTSSAAARPAPNATPLPLRPAALTPPPPMPIADEDARVKSLRRLLWVLWGLGWVLVPITIGPLAPRLIPIIMFGWMAALLVVGWDRGALLRDFLRKREARRAGPTVDLAASREPSPVGARVDSGPQVRVRTSDLRQDEVVGHTELEVSSAEPRRAARP